MHATHREMPIRFQRLINSVDCVVIEIIVGANFVLPFVSSIVRQLSLGALIFFPTTVAEGKKISREKGIGFRYATSQN